MSNGFFSGRVLRNTGYLGLAEVLCKALGLMITVVAARNLGSGGFGLFSLVLSSATIFAVLSDFGFETTIIRDVAAHRGDLAKYFGNVLSLKAVLSIAVLLLAAIYGFIMPTGGGYLVAIACVFLVLWSFTTAYTAVATGREEMWLEALSRVLLRFIILAVALFQHSVLGFFLAHVAGSAVVFAVVATVVHYRFVRSSLRWDAPLVRSITSSSSQFFLVSALSTAYLRIDTVILAYFRGYEATGIYGAASFLVQAIFVAPALYSKAWFPRLSDSSVTKRSVFYSCALMFLAGASIAFVLALFAQDIVGIVYGREFAGSASLLAILGLSLPAVFANTYMISALYGLRRQKSVILVTGFALIMNIALNIAFVPAYSAYACAIAAIVGQYAVFLAYLILLFVKGM